MNYRRAIIVAFICLVIGLIIGNYIAGRENRARMIDRWSVGIYKGSSPFNLSSRNIKNPVLTYKDIKDVDAEFVADPFMVKEGPLWYMFFEVMNSRTQQGDIALATSMNGIDWEYKQIVLDESFHLSYPYVFKWKDDYYMIPESKKANSLRLYKAVEFPIRWKFMSRLLRGKYVDPSLARYNGKWWLFAETNPQKRDTLSLYYADDLKGPWIEHPKSPVVKGDANIARPGGRVLVLGNRIFRFTQDDTPSYGNQVWAFEITKLSSLDYEENKLSKNPIVKASGSGWNEIGMHHIDPHQISKYYWIACVDGYEKVLVYRGTYFKEIRNQ